MSDIDTTVTTRRAAGRMTRTRAAGVMLTVYRWSLAVFLAAGIVQIFLAGFGAFRLAPAPGQRPRARSAPDARLRKGGMAIIILILTLIARAGPRAVVGAVLLVFMISWPLELGRTRAS